MSKRKFFTPQQKIAIIRRHLLEKVPVSDLCDEFGIHATQFYAWQKQLFEGGGPSDNQLQGDSPTCDCPAHLFRRHGRADSQIEGFY